jgi:hypothetical protein
MIQLLHKVTVTTFSCDILVHILHKILAVRGPLEEKVGSLTPLALVHLR